MSSSEEPLLPSPFLSNGSEPRPVSDVQSSAVSATPPSMEPQENHNLVRCNSSQNSSQNLSQPLDSTDTELLRLRHKYQLLEQQIKETAKENRKLQKKLQRSESDRVYLERHYEVREGMFNQVLQNLEVAQAEKERQNQELNQALNQLRMMQGKLVEAEKMSALGVLVAGVAHEINNPISFIHGNVEIANDYLADLVSLIKLYQTHYPTPHAEIIQRQQAIDLAFLADDIFDLLQSMKVGSDRIREIVLSLRTFSRHDEAEFKEADIHRGLDSTLMILQHRLKENGREAEIVIQKDYGDLPLIPCFAGQLNQVFMNILSNAVDALRDSREWIALEAEALENTEALEKKEPPEPTIWIKTCVQLTENTALIKIGNNGPPIPDAIRDRLFEPFFTTKGVGQGTGLGLSISYQIIVDRHLGQINCASSNHFGTEFSIEIPLAGSPVAEE